MYVDSVPAVLDDLSGRGVAQGAGGQLTGAQQQAAHQAVCGHAGQVLFAEKYISYKHQAVLWIRIRMFLGLLNPDTDPDKDPTPEPSIIYQKQKEKP